MAPKAMPNSSKPPISNTTGIPMVSPKYTQIALNE
jgi:hypothetical protein